MPNRHATAGAPISADRPAREAAEAALVENYPGLVRLAYLILPPELGRHRRVLTAHALVQRTLSEAGGRTRSGAPASDSFRSGPPAPDSSPREALPTDGLPWEAPPTDSSPPAIHRRDSPAGSESSRPAVTLPAQRGADRSGRGAERPAHAWLRAAVVRAALRPPRRFAPSPRLPLVLGLRLFPRAGGTDELTLDRALAGATAGTRAALALRVLEGLPVDAITRLLGSAGVADPGAALRAADRLGEASGTDVAALLGSAEFDPCTLHARPTDLLRRRRRERFAALAGAALLASTAVVSTAELRSGTGSARAETSTALAADALVRAMDPAALVRAPAERWADTSRVDLTAWPPRGAGTGDAALLRRALDAWARGGATDVRLTATPGTTTAPPAEPPRLLYAGTVDGAGVVLLHDGRRLARYAEPRDGRGPAALDLARADDADVTTGAAVVLSRTPGRARFLLAPWIAEAGVRDLRAPGAAARPLDVAPDGVTAPVPYDGPGGCDRVPALQLTSSSRIVEDHAFLLADLGELTPAHLTWTPGPGTGAPARAPREATDERGLAAWARSACSLAPLHGTGVRSVNRWEYAEQALPERAGRAVWVCSRVDTWEGSGGASVSFEPPPSPAAPPVPFGTTGAVPRAVAELRSTAACSRFGQHVLAGTYWTAPSGRRYLLAAGSRHLTGITAGGAVSATGRGPVLSAAAGADGPVRLTGRLADGSTLPGWTAPTGHRP